jgi:hypothetical protein
MQNQQQCPHCDHPHVKPMNARPHEAESGVTWYQCLGCERIWASPKPGTIDFGGRT